MLSADTARNWLGSGCAPGGPLTGVNAFQYADLRLQSLLLILPLFSIPSRALSKFKNVLFAGFKILIIYLCYEVQWFEKHEGEFGFSLLTCLIFKLLRLNRYYFNCRVKCFKGGPTSADFSGNDFIYGWRLFTVECL